MATSSIVPGGCVDLIWSSDRALFVAGPDTGPVPYTSTVGERLVAVRLQIGVAARVVGEDLSQLTGGRPELADLWGSAAARRLAEQVEAASDPIAGQVALGAAAAERLRRAGGADREVAALVDQLHGSGPVTRAAADVGLSPRQVRRRFAAEVGYGPKFLQRVLRFQRFLAEPLRRGETLAARAAAVGYVDHAHLARDCRQLAGATPSALLAG